MSAILVIHVVISLVGILSGFVVIYGFIAARRSEAWTATFLATTIATSATGFLLPADRFLPSHALAILSLIALFVATYARYGQKSAGVWRKAYVVTVVLSQYFNVFVLFVQLFQKVPVLKALAPTQSEPVFLVTQVLLLAAFVIMGVLSVRRYRALTAGVA